MAEGSNIQEFPEINNKLAAPTKKSLFERQKAEAEAKRLREEAETAAVYEDFVKSFEDDGGTARLPSVDDRLTGRDATGPGRGAGFGGPPKRHFAAPGTGPASRGGLGSSRGRSLGSGPGSLGPGPSSVSRKRTHDGDHPAQRDSTQSLFAFDDAPTGPIQAKSALQELDDDNEQETDEFKAEQAAPKPTLHLSLLPPGTSPAVIKSYLPSNIEVDAVRILPASGAGSSDRKSTAALVTLAKGTPANDIDAAVNALQNRYLGWGYYLSISRHLSSAALSAGVPVVSGPSSMLSSMPFGARPVQTGPGSGLNRGPPPSSVHRGGFAPPTSYASGQYARGPPTVQVSVTPPTDFKQLKLIHKTLEALLTHGPEFEALLMSRTEVQLDERWSWLWDPRSPGGVWYRWRLWEIISNSQGSQRGRRSQKNLPNQIFEGGAAWFAPAKRLRFEYATRLEEFVSDSDYDSSEDEYGNEDRQQPHHQEGLGAGDGILGGNWADGKSYLNPLQKSKLTHLLARLPETSAKLRKGDVARITAFAIEHAGEGADEVVDMIVSNIQKPLSFTDANPDKKKEEEPWNKEAEAEDKERPRESEDMSSAKLVALYIVSDILSSSSTSGVRHAWRYRQLFEAALKQRRVFEGLGQLDKQLQWGRLRAEKWKRSVSSVLTLWEGWCVFPQSSQEHFTSAFLNPPPTAAEEAKGTKTNTSSEKSDAMKSKWKTVDVTARPIEDTRPMDLNAKPTLPKGTANSNELLADEDLDLDGEPMEDIDGEPMEEDVDGEPMEDEAEQRFEGGEESADLPSQGASVNETTRPNEGNGPFASSKTDPKEDGREGPVRRRRPKAEDMFADSDEEDVI